MHVAQVSIEYWRLGWLACGGALLVTVSTTNDLRTIRLIGGEWCDTSRCALHTWPYCLMVHFPSMLRAENREADDLNCRLARHGTCSLQWTAMHLPPLPNWTSLCSIFYLSPWLSSSLTKHVLKLLVIIIIIIMQTTESVYSKVSQRCHHILVKYNSLHVSTKALHYQITFCK